MALGSAAREFGREEAGDCAREVGGECEREIKAEGLGGPLGGHVGVVGGAVPGWGKPVWLGGAPSGVGEGEEAGGGMLVGEGEGPESGGVRGKVGLLGPGGEGEGGCVGGLGRA